MGESGDIAGNLQAFHAVDESVDFSGPDVGDDLISSGVSVVNGL